MPRRPPARSRSVATLAAALALLLGPAGGGTGRGEDRVTVRGVYFREPSTRVVQPMLHVSKDLPQGYDVSAHYLLDAISSASIASGALQDEIFTEYRNEVGLAAGKTYDRTRFGLLYRYSREPDYISHTAGLQVTQGVWENSGTVGVAFAAGSDTIGPNLNMRLRVWFGSVSYEQALSPTLRALLGYEATFFDGFFANPYIQVPNLGREKLPDERLRHAAVARLAHYRPRWRAGAQLAYRFYFDQGGPAFSLVGRPDDPLASPWYMSAHTVEGRLFKELGRDFELRLTYRYHSQAAAQFWCNTNPRTGGRTDCYGTFPLFYSADEKLGPLATHMPELKLFWEARPLARVPLLRYLAEGTFEASYGYFMQTTHYENGHLLQTGYSLPF